MAEFEDRHERIEKGKRWVEEICRRRHDIAKVDWTDHEESAHLHYWLALPPRQQRESVHLTFTLQELADCATDLNVRVQLMRRIHDEIAPWLSPREAQDF